MPERPGLHHIEEQSGELSAAAETGPPWAGGSGEG